MRVFSSNSPGCCRASSQCSSWAVRRRCCQGGIALGQQTRGPLLQMLRSWGHSIRETEQQQTLYFKKERAGDRRLRWEGPCQGPEACRVKGNAELEAILERAPAAGGERSVRKGERREKREGRTWWCVTLRKEAGKKGQMHSWTRAGLFTASTALTMGHAFQFKFELN